MVINSIQLVHTFSGDLNRPMYIKKKYIRVSVVRVLRRDDVLSLIVNVDALDMLAGQIEKGCWNIDFFSNRFDLISNAVTRCAGSPLLEIERLYGICLHRLYVPLARVLDIREYININSFMSEHSQNFHSRVASAMYSRINEIQIYIIMALLLTILMSIQLEGLYKIIQHHTLRVCC